jgi:hypothetical protein
MGYLYREPSIDASHQVSFHLGKRFQRRRFFRNRPIRNKNYLWWPYLLMDRDEMSIPYRGPSIHASYQVSVHWTKCFQRRIFLEIDQSETRIVWWPWVLENPDDMANLYRGRSKVSSYQMLDHLGKRFQRRFFRNQPFRNKNCLWRPCLLTDQDEMGHLYRGPSINASYQVSVHLGKHFQKRRFF